SLVRDRSGVCGRRWNDGLKAPEARRPLQDGARFRWSEPRPLATPRVVVDEITTAAYEPAEPTALPTVENVRFALLPSVAMAAMQTTMINASMTAYSTAVGPSSFLRKASA